MERIESTNPMDHVYKFHHAMKTQNLIMVYEGEINQMITNTFTAMAERDMEASSDDEYPLYKRLYHVMVECLQNVCKHAEDSEFSLSNNSTDKVGSGIVMISEENRVFNVITGNKVDEDKVEELKTMIDEINSLDKAEIKQLYKTKLKESRLSDKGGAGLGFIDLVKKTGNKLEYKFEKLSDGKVFFILKTMIS